VLIRTWNLFHGNTVPPGRRAYLREMVELVTADRPDIVCLQELPVWALDRVAEWSRMRALTVLTMRPRAGGLAYPITRLHHGMLRSALTGQGNAILFAPELELDGEEVAALNAHRFAEEHAASFGLDRANVRAWLKNRRVVQVVQVKLADGRPLQLGHVHCTSSPTDPRLPDVELREAAGLLTEPIAILAGDFNVTPEDSPAIRELAAGGYSEPGPGIDHILVRGAPTSGLRIWPTDEREFAGRVLSDHAPVELTIEL
jgi:endonuclease/exonuclease/phosphatase family metal-dependent hydrolase